MKQKIQNAVHQMNCVYTDMMDVYDNIKDIDDAEHIRRFIVATASATKMIAKKIERLNKEVKTND